MALDGTLMGTAVASALEGLSTAQKEKPEDIWKAVCKAIVTHITTNGVVTIPPSAIVTAGSAATQTGPALAVPLKIT